MEQRHPFPDDPNVETCVHGGGRAYARVDASGTLRGWYGSTVADLSTFVVVRPDFPRGPISDARIREALASGEVFDPDTVRDGTLDVTDVPEEALVATFVSGATSAAVSASLEGNAGAPCSRVRHPDEDDPLTEPFRDALAGGTDARGPDLLLAGRLAYMARVVRGLSTDEAAIRACALDHVSRLVSDRRLTSAMLAGLASTGGPVA